MARVKLSGSRQFSKLKRSVRSAKREIKTSTRKTLREQGAVAKANAKADLAHQDAVASSELLNSITARVIGGTSRGAPGWGLRFKANAPHAGLVEFGTGDKFKPNSIVRRYRAPSYSEGLINALVRWAIVKPTIQTGNPVGLARAVALRISGRTDRPSGTAPQPFFVENARTLKIRVKSRIKVRTRRAIDGIGT